MTDGSEGGDEATPAHLSGIEADAVESGDSLRLTPEQHQKLKDQLHGSDRFDDLRRADRRYLVVGRGGDGGPGERRRMVRDRLDRRSGAVAVRLEAFGFTGEDIDLWAPAFDILAAMATHVVGVLEDFDGGHVWELGVLYHRQVHVRDSLWLLKRVYGTAAAMRDHYDNGMAASHLAALERAAGDRVLEWRDRESLRSAVDSIP